MTLLPARNSRCEVRSAQVAHTFLLQVSMYALQSAKLQGFDGIRLLANHPGNSFHVIAQNQPGNDNLPLLVGQLIDRSRNGVPLFTYLCLPHGIAVWMGRHYCYIESLALFLCRQRLKRQSDRLPLLSAVVASYRDTCDLKQPGGKPDLVAGPHVMNTLNHPHKYLGCQVFGCGSIRDPGGDVGEDARQKLAIEQAQRFRFSLARKIQLTTERQRLPLLPGCPVHRSAPPEHHTELPFTRDASPLPDHASPDGPIFSRLLSPQQPDNGKSVFK